MAYQPRHKARPEPYQPPVYDRPAIDIDQYGRSLDERRSIAVKRGIVFVAIVGATILINHEISQPDTPHDGQTVVTPDSLQDR